MSITILVTFDELPPGSQGPFPFPEEQYASLFDLEEKYRGAIAERLPAAQRETLTDSRHFWYNGELQQHKGRAISHIARASVIALNFRRDTYLVSTPGKQMDRTIDPELKVSEVLEWLQENKYIGSSCCYEVVDGNGAALDTDKTLYELRVWPYTDPTNKSMSHLRIRMQQGLMRKAYFLLAACAVAGVAFGWAVHRFGKL